MIGSHPEGLGEFIITGGVRRCFVYDDVAWVHERRDGWVFLLRGRDLRGRAIFPELYALGE